MNLNELAKEIAKREGKKVQVNIAQIKEILRVMKDIFEDRPEDVQILQKGIKKLANLKLSKMI